VLYPIELLARRCDCSVLQSGEEKILAAEEGDDIVEGGGPTLPGCFVVGAEGFDVEADGEALLRAGEVNKSGAEDAVEGGFGVIESGSAAGEAAEELLLLVERGKEVAVAP
jgi:hypothetical protein